MNNGRKILYTARGRRYQNCTYNFLTQIANNNLSFGYRNLRTKTPTQILFNFCIALSLTLIVFLLAAERSKTTSTASCRAAAIALHYFVLAVFMWMAIEAYNMYLCFVKIIPTDISHFMKKCLIVGWGMLQFYHYALTY